MDDQTDYRQARCQAYDREVFFPLGDPETGFAVEMAKDICRACPISEECLQDHILDQYGIVGGTTPGERRRIARQVGITRRPSPAALAR